ncbi:Hypothetical protein HDN1F_16780 [gamma proteobacterium HdN1]|nr:Hypothetical protein HDN1F_16780 [gamma proteobacterium HdN1]
MHPTLRLLTFVSLAFPFASQAATVADSWNTRPAALENSAAFGNVQGARSAVVPLFSVSLSGSTQKVNTNSVDVQATVSRWTVQQGYTPAFTSRQVDFTLQPGHKELVKLKPLKIAPEASVQSFVGNMVVDGALTVNMVKW